MWRAITPTTASSPSSSPSGLTRIARRTARPRSSSAPRAPAKGQSRRGAPRERSRLGSGGATGVQSSTTIGGALSQTATMATAVLDLPLALQLVVYGLTNGAVVALNA